MKKRGMHWLRAVLDDLERGVFSLAFLCSVAGTVVVLIFGSTSQWFPSKAALEDGLAWQYYLTVLDTGYKSEAFVFCLPLLAAFPAGISVLTEVQNGFLKSYLPRCGRGNYVTSKVLLSIISGGGSVFLGYLLAAGGMSLVYRPLENGPGPENISRWPESLQQGLVAFLAGALFAMLAATLGLLFRNRYMAFGGAFMVSYLLIIITSRYATDIYTLNPREWFLQKHYWEGKAMGCAGFLVELCLVLALAYGQLLYVRIGSGKRGWL